MIIETLKFLESWDTVCWYWRITSQGHTLLSSKRYVSKANADRAARKFFNNAYKLRLVVK